MPEGDTIYRAARRVGAVLQGRTIDRIAGSDRALRKASGRLLGATVLAVRSRGKHHLIDFDLGWSIRSHMGMTGTWRVMDRSRPPGSARIVLETEDARAACFGAPDIEVGMTPDVESGLAHLGPDLCADDFDTDAATARLGGVDAARPVGEALLDQSVLAGIGNVFKNEIMFLERLHPDAFMGDVADIGRLTGRARTLLMANRYRARRVTTGETRPGAELWVYDRAGRPCRRCRTPVAVDADRPRITYWCPRCQPGP